MLYNLLWYTVPTRITSWIAYSSKCFRVTATVHSQFLMWDSHLKITFVVDMTGVFTSEKCLRNIKFCAQTAARLLGKKYTITGIYLKDSIRLNL